MNINNKQITKEWARWLRARKAGYTGDIVWSDEDGYEAYTDDLRRSYKSNLLGDDEGRDGTGCVVKPVHG